MRKSNSSNGVPQLFGKRLPSRGERGAVLIFALIVLLIMTVLAISGIGNSTLEQRMAGNYSQSMTAFQAAEQGLRAVEDWMFTKWEADPDIRDLEAADWWFQVTGVSDGLYSDMYSDPDAAKVCRGDDSCEFDPRDETQWCTDVGNAACRLPKSFVTLSNTVGTNTSLHGLDIGSVGDDLDGNGTIDTVARQPQFIIEYVGPMGEKAPVLTMGKPPLEPNSHAFKITVIAWGQDVAARHVLQSHVILAIN
jgi:type IV pilus assembly protein PilX